MSSKNSKSDLVGEVVAEFRISGNHDSAFDAQAAKRLGVNDTDLHCLNIIESRGGLTAGELAKDSGLTTGAVTGVIDRLEKAGYARRVADPGDRRRVKVEVTEDFYTRADEIWGPLATEFQAALADRFTPKELEGFAELLRTTSAIAARHTDRLRAMGQRRER